MSSDFAFLAGMARSTVDAVHGEAATLKPTDRAKGPHGQVGPSATRPEAPIVAAFFQDTEREARKRALPMLGQTGERLLNRSPEIYASTGYAGDIAVGDRILRDAPGILFEVISRDFDGIGNAILGLAQIKNG